MTPLFTIITVTYNAETTIERTLQSVASQTCKVYEHLIIDGLSTDATADIVNAFDNPRMKMLRQKDSGVYDAMNNGLAAATGDYVIFLNAGDKFHSPDTLQQIADAIMANDYPGIVYGQTDLVDNQGHYLGPRHLQAPSELSLDSFRDGMTVCHQAMTVLRTIAPYYNLRYRYSSDYEWAIICLQHSRRNVYLPMTVVDYLSEGITTANHRKSLKERYSIMCTYFGTIPTLLRHARFAVRYLMRRRNAKNIQ